MKKPTPKTFTALDYHQCRDWVEKKLGKDLRNYAGSNYNNNKPYLDFWHYILEDHDISNGCFFNLSVEDGDWDADWVREIKAAFREEFEEYFEDEEEWLNFWVSW